MRCSLRLSYAVALAVLRLPAQTGAPGLPPETLFVHGSILTGTHLRSGDGDPVPGRVQAMAVRAGTILAVGNDATLLATKGPTTTVIDLHGAFVMPGFNDAHTHMASAGQQRLGVDLVGTRSLAEMQARIRTYVGSARPGQWVLGGGWDHTLWPGKKLPSRADLDAVSAGHPIFLMRVDGHIAVANTAGLLAAHLDSQTPDPDGAKFDRTPDGELTGIVREAAALALIESHIPKPDTELRQRALTLSINDALAHGVTSVQDYSDWEDWLVLEGLERRGKLPLRFSEWMDFNLPVPVLESRRASHASDDPLLHLGQLKGFMDGSLGSRTAALKAPYGDDPANSGIPRYDEDKLEQLSAARGQAGFQIGFHAIGDRANDMALDALEAAEQTELDLCSRTLDSTSAQDATECQPGAPHENPRDLRFRIEHAQVVSPEAFDRYARLGVIASMQPSHLLTDMAWAEQRLGPERIGTAYAWRSFLQHGVTLAFGTDYPVESISPFRGLYAAVTRQNEAGTQTFVPSERLTLNEAIYAYTQASAFAEFRERSKGRLEPGYLADFVVLDRDITAVPPRELLGTKVLRTVVGGVTRYEAGSAGSASADRAPTPAGGTE